MNSDARISQAAGNGAFVKNASTGKIYRFGPEEMFLLRRLGGGMTPEAVVEAFGARFGKMVRPETVRRFADEMLSVGVLTIADEGNSDRPAQLPAVLEQPEEAAENDEAGEDEGPDDGGPDSPGLDSTLEDMVFGEKAEARAKQARSSAGTDREDARFEDVEAPGEGVNPDRATADPAVARRRLRFTRGGESKRKPPGMLRLFDPTPLLWLLSALFGWVRHFKWLLWPLTAFAILTLLHRLKEAGLNVASARATFTLPGVLALSLVTVNLFTRLVTGTVAYRLGAQVRHFGLIFVLFVIPRFAIDTSRVLKLSREDKLAVYASTMQARLFAFIAGTITWALTRQSATLVSEVALIIGNIGLLTLLLTALPLLQSDGYRWLSTYFNQPFLRQRAMAFAFGPSAKRDKFPPPTPREKWAFALYAIASVLFIGLIATVFVIYTSTALEGRYRGAGVVMFLAIIGLLLLWSLMMRASRSEYRKELMTEIAAEKAAEQADRKVGLPARRPESTREVGRARERLPLRTPRSQPLPGVYSYNARSARRARWVRRGALAVLLIALGYVAFQPYQYEVGGDFQILPNRRVEVVARVPGELIEIAVDEGDVVEEGQLLGRVLDRQARRDYEVTAAELERARAALRRKVEGATPEEIQVAREQVALAETVLPFREAQAERAKALLEGNIIAATEAEKRQTEYLQTLQELQTARANLAEVEAKAPESEIMMAEAEVSRLEAELAYHEAQLEDTALRAAKPGRVVTENLALSLGTYLDKGDVFVEIEDHSVANAQVKVSETDIDLVEIGDRVRLKTWGRSSTEHVGRVISIAPVAETEDFGQIVRIKTLIPNEDGFLRPEMTGFAKIDGAEMPVWEAYTRLFDRFFRIEVWSWIP